MKKPRSIRRRLVAGYFLLTLLTVTLVGVLALSLVKRYTDRQETEFLTANAEAVARRAAPLLAEIDMHQTPALFDLARTAAFLGNVQVRILDPAGQVIADSGPQDSADDFIWIQQAAGHHMSLELDPSLENHLIFRALTDEVDHTSYASIMILPGSDTDLDGLFPEQLPPGFTYLRGRRRADVWGRQMMFDVTKSVVWMEESGDEIVSQEQIKALPDRAPGEAGEAAVLPGDDETGAESPRSERVITVSIGDSSAPLGFVELSNGPNFGLESVATTRRALMVSAVGTLVLSVIVGVFVSRSLTAPLHTLTAATDAMTAGNLGIRAPVESQDEIGRLARQFNHMAERLEASFAELAAERDALRRFIADASHEFRTPITALKNFNELLQGSAADDPAARAEFLIAGEKQLQRLDWITQNLLSLSRFDAGFIELDLTEEEAGTLLTAAVTGFQGAAQERKIDLRLEPLAGPVRLKCDRPRLELALGNLLDNALRFTPPGGQITVGCMVEAGAVQLRMSDTGPGIDPADLPHIFQRFYQGQSGGHHPIQTTGCGLGLAIVQSIMQAHGGQVRVENRPAGGSCFTLVLPRLNADDATAEVETGRTG